MKRRNGIILTLTKVGDRERVVALGRYISTLDTELFPASCFIVTQLVVQKQRQVVQEQTLLVVTRDKEGQVV